MDLKYSLLAGCVAGALAFAPAFAQDASVISPDFEAPTTVSYFDGLYAGLLLGGSGNDYFNLFSGTATDRLGVGGVLGWSTAITPDVALGIEGRLFYSTDFGSSHGFDVFALGRIGIQPSDDVMVYFAGGPGLQDGVPAFAFGQGVEARLWDNLSGRIEALGIVQLTPNGAGAYRSGVTGWSITSGLLWHFGEGAHDLSGPGIATADMSQEMDFSGAYVGTDFGLLLNFPYNFFVETGNGLHLTRIENGVFGGWNFQLTENVLGGFEVQGGLLYDTSGDVTFDALALARLGVQPTNRMFVYALGGAGVLQNKAAYAAGVGAEYALWDSASIRAEYIALGELSGSPAVHGFSAHKMTAGMLWHLE